MPVSRAASVDQFDEQLMIGTPLVSQLANDRFLMIADGEAVLVKSNIGPVQAKAINHLTYLFPELVNALQVSVPMCPTSTARVAVVNRVAQVSHVFRGMDDWDAIVSRTASRESPKTPL